MGGNMVVFDCGILVQTQLQVQCNIMPCVMILKSEKF